MWRWRAERWCWAGNVRSETGQAVLLLVAAMAAVLVGAVLLGDTGCEGFMVRLVGRPRTKAVSWPTQASRTLPLSVFFPPAFPRASQARSPRRLRAQCNSGTPSQIAVLPAGRWGDAGERSCPPRWAGRPGGRAQRPARDFERSRRAPRTGSHASADSVHALRRGPNGRNEAGDLRRDRATTGDSFRTVDRQLVRAAPGGRSWLSVSS
jgi:hypothetical protein